MKLEVLRHLTSNYTTDYNNQNSTVLAGKKDTQNNETELRAQKLNHVYMEK